MHSPLETAWVRPWAANRSGLISWFVRAYPGLQYRRGDDGRRQGDLSRKITVQVRGRDLGTQENHQRDGQPAQRFRLRGHQGAKLRCWPWTVTAIRSLPRIWLSQAPVAGPP